MNSKTTLASYFRSFIFGVEDSLVSTVGLLSGVAIANVPRKTIFLTGVVLIFVEAFSMAVGSFLSEYSAEEYMKRAEAPPVRSVITGTIMFFSYFASGFVPLFPYIILPMPLAFLLSILFSLAALFLLGVVSAKISGLNVLKGALRMLVIGGLAAAIGIIVGKVIGDTVKL
ncbi:VIT1/CCC1 transporter family protein [Candidatus Uhrbacteria bacterium]|nr:VIT1/CCC1 transporter family protein [Candidatus Uhrbacteria bacterium]